MATYCCKMCGGTLELKEGQTVAHCLFCGSLQTIPRIDEDVMANWFNRANAFRLKAEFDKAQELYEKIINEGVVDSEAYWGLVLCKYGVEYVDDPKTKKKVPTCHRTQVESILTDVDFLSAIENCDDMQKEVYRKQAKEIEKIQKGILAIANKEEPFDVFICYKETDERGKRTPDSALANDVYHQLVEEGFKVFYSAITLEDKLGREYEPYIYAALKSARVMLVVGTKPEYFNSVWVKNEWSRFLKIMSKDRKRLLIPCYKGMDAYELPIEFAHFQAQDMSKIGFINDLVRGIKKIGKTKQTRSADYGEGETYVQTVAPLLRRIQMFLDEGLFDTADEYAEKVLDLEPENSDAYITKLLCDLKLKNDEELSEVERRFDKNPNYVKAVKFGNGERVDRVKGYAENLLESQYLEIHEKTVQAKNSRDWRNIEGWYETLGDYKDSEELKSQAKQKAVELEIAERIDKEYVAAELLFNKGTKGGYSQAKELYERNPNYRDSAEKIEECEKVLAKLNKRLAIKKKITLFFSGISVASLTLVAILLCVFLVPGYIRPLTIDGISYRTRLDYVEIVDVDKNKTVLEIPNQVRGTKVTELNDGCFKGCNRLSKITLPENLTSIPNEFFYECSMLVSVELPNTVTSIGDNAFYNCYCLPKLDFPQTLQSIGEKAFMRCSDLKTLAFAEGLQSIGDKAFTRCYALTTVVLPDSLQELGEGVFSYCDKLLSINIPKNLKVIKPFTFQNCTVLEVIILPDGLTEIEDYAFIGCESLYSMSIPLSVTRIGDNAFQHCKNLTISYAGTMAQWEMIEGSFKQDIIGRRVICSDGTITIS